MTQLLYTIQEEKNIIDDNFLDIIGSQFKFDHEKGLAEWLKNAADAYIRSSASDADQFIIIRFTDGVKDDALFECIDFNGMTSVDIDKALKRWGDPDAARRGLKSKVYGGHGNGGKFYMRQMFSRSYFVTYKDGILNVFGFNEKRKYGFASGFRDKKIDYKSALKVADLKVEDIPTEYLNKIKEGKTGFTVVKGISPTGMPNKIKAVKICEKLRKHPQAIRLLDRIRIHVVYNNKTVYDQLKPDTVKPLADFSEPLVFSIPEQIVFLDDGEKQIAYLSNKKYTTGRLLLRTSEIALTQNSKYSELNRIDIIGEIGVIASYQLRELGLYYPQTDFIYGECECPILEDQTDDCVSNDRSKLVDNLKSKALLQWIKEMVKDLCKQIALKDEKEQQHIHNRILSNYNHFLNEWKNRFMSKLLNEILVGPGDGPGGGTGTGGSLGEYGSGNGTGGRSGGGQGGNEGGGNTPKKGKKFPEVLISDHNDDPFNSGHPLSLRPEQGLVYQRPQDVQAGIYWINKSSPLASLIEKKFGIDSARWRDYLFQRYVDIFIKEALTLLERKDPERFNAATIDGDIFGKLASKIHEAAAEELNAFLFNDHYDTGRTDNQKT